MSEKRYPEPSAVLELLKPITWFPPMWAFACGVVSSGAPILANARIALTGVVLAGPLVCAMSQAINDWHDREVDAINEPNRPIPSGRIPGKWGLYIAGVWTVLSLLVAATLGRWVLSPPCSGSRSPGPTARRPSGSSATAGSATRPADFPTRAWPG